ncbi:MAG TPA: glycoside hydrolase family 9 protein [Acetivibrio thermocellus]|nr:glycoside hydrolase family 9 protein [Acetivibrio thermocellus]
MAKRRLSLLLVLAIMFTMVVPQISASAETVAPEGYRKLLDVQIFKDSPVVGWSGSGMGELETIGDTLPVDTTVTYNGLPTLRLNVQTTVQSGWWISLLTLRGWNTHDLSQYVENGYLEFDIKGKEGGEDFVIGFRDKVYERVYGLEIDVTTVISNYVTVTTDWQHVKIPLRDLMKINNGFDPSSVTCLVFSKRYADPFTVWFSDIKITSEDNEKSAPAIKVNQLGFIPEAEKYALVTGFAEELAVSEGDEFAVINAADNSVAYTGKLTLVTEYEPLDSGEKILKADFSDLTVPGKYYISIEGLDNSPKFEIGEGIYGPLVVDAARYFYYQRQGIELEEPYAQGYPRKDVTPQDAYAVFASGKKDPIDITKGWYDAGDFGKYVNAGATGVSDLFWAYEMFPSQFVDGQFNIPESGNGVPDILDEARWELEWMLKMQDKESGGFYPRVQSDNDENIKSRIIRDQNGCTTDDTACAAGILAHAYLIYKDIDPDFAQECLDAAINAWKFLEKNPENIVSPPGPYNVYDDSGDRLWAAASLYRATGEEVYHTYFKQNYKSFAQKFESPTAYAHTWGDMWLTAFLSYLKAENKDQEVVDWIDTEFGIWLENILTRYENNPWKNAIVPGNYFWGINMQVMNVPMDAIIGSQLLGKYSDRIEKLGFGSLNWLLGTNPLRFSFVSGYGEDSVKGVFSNIYNTDGKQGIPKGYMPGGPNAYEGAGLSRFAAKCYTRSTGDWVANEHTVYWNSALVFMAAFANQGSEVNPGPAPEPGVTPNPTEPAKVVDIRIDTSAERKPISPYIYGSNQELDATVTAKRFGGNRTTGYNWENNFSNAGSDWLHYSDTYLLEDGGVPKGEWSTPASVVTTFHDKALSKNVPYTLITLQAAGYVSADGNGPVSQEETAPSSRWKEVKFEKGAPFSLTPDTEDDYVYMDEFVNYLVNKYGNASTPTGIKGYSIDNEPALWSHTHPRIHPDNVTAKELIEKSVALSKAVKKVDPYAEIFGPALYGFAAYETLQSAPDWGTEGEGYRWFIDYYLDKMKKASDEEGKRLLDVLDVHWYPEARGGGERICFGADPRNIETNKARLQAPRTLWDPTYIEDSWIGQWKKDFLPILPNLLDSIEKYYPGTKLAITEYDYGGGNHITGGIAQADVLGIFGKYGVYLATFWGDASNNYTEAGINLYTNYDGKGGKFGDTSVKCETSDIEVSSAYASIVGEDDSKLHIILLNKNYDQPTTFNFSIDSSKNYTIGNVWAFDRGSSNITQRTPIVNIKDNTFTYTVPALTACHIVLEAAEPVVYGDLNNDSKVNAVDIMMLKRYILGIIDNINLTAADIYFDGVVNSSDYNIMKRYLLKAIEDIPYVPENQAPKAIFTFSPEDPVTDENVVFNASNSIDEDGTIAYYVWDFGDGYEGTSTTPTITYKYKNPGTYKVKLIVTDNQGASSSFTATIKVTSATGDNSKFNFEDGTLGGFTTSGTNATGVVVNTTEKAFKGERGLKWTVTSEGEGTAELKLDGGTIVVPGTTMTFRIWIPSGAPIADIQPYIMPHTPDWSEVLWNSTWKGYTMVKTDDWNEITLTLPEDVDPTWPQQMGIQVQTIDEGEFTIYVDAIDW